VLIAPGLRHASPIERLKGDEAIAEADTILLSVPNQLGVDYNAHVIEAILTSSRRDWGGGEGPFRRLLGALAGAS
jgi:hypothetical protein